LETEELNGVPVIRHPDGGGASRGCDMSCMNPRDWVDVHGLDGGYCDPSGKYFDVSVPVDRIVLVGLDEETEGSLAARLGEEEFGRAMLSVLRRDFRDRGFLVLLFPGVDNCGGRG
jgi:hypothetical protein